MGDLPDRLRSCVYDGPRSAVYPLADALSIEPAAAKDILEAIVKAGFFVAPRIPTDAMLVAYFDSYGMQPITPSGMVRGIGKARLRWQKMGSAGTAVALSTRYPPAPPSPTEPAVNTPAGAGNSPVGREG